MLLTELLTAWYKYIQHDIQHVFKLRRRENGSNRNPQTYLQIDS